MMRTTMATAQRATKLTMTATARRPMVQRDMKTMTMVTDNDDDDGNGAMGNKVDDDGEGTMGDDDDDDDGDVTGDGATGYDDGDSG